MEDIEKLEGCPFCGGTYDNHKGGCFFYILEQEGRGAEYSEDVIEKAWNQRQEPQGWVSVKDSPLEYGMGEVLTCNMNQQGVQYLVSVDIHGNYMSKGEIHCLPNNPSFTHWQQKAKLPSAP